MLKSLHQLFLAILLLAAWPALAQTDPPSRVGRIAHLDGDVGFRVDRRDEGGPATLNWPVSSGAVLDSGRSGRAEVWIGSTAYRLSRDSEVEFPVVDDRRVDVRLNGGTLAVSVLDRDQADDVEVMTPDGNVRFQTPGRYRINVYEERSELVVLAGRATVDNGRRTIPVAAGQMAVVDSNGGERLEAARAYDGFDQWVAQRENATLADTARRHVSPHMTGYQDLDAYGDWRSTSDYGTVWYPRAVASDWAPYRQGRWAWVPPWGWTWIDQAPWGFAPFHYGRWAFIAGRWAWVPGRVVARPVYAPALVGWVGNPGWSVSFSFGSAPAVGWFPLAPREVYVPAYRYSPSYVRQINVTQVTNVIHIDRIVRGAPPAYAHHALPQAVTVVPTSQMREGRPITSSEIRHQDRRDLSGAPLAPQAPSAQWLAPAPAALRPQGGERGGQRQRGRDFDGQRNPDGMPSTDGRGRPTENAAQPSRRENGRRPADAPQESRPGSLRPQDAAGESRREFFRRQQEGRSDNGSVPSELRRDERSPPAVTPSERQQRRDMREMQYQERQSRQPESSGAPQPVGPRDTSRPQDGMAPSAPVRREITQSAPAPLRREMTPQSVPQREMPRPTPEVRMPPPQPAAPPSPRAEPPRQQPAPQGGNEPHRRRDEERGQR